MKTIVVDCEPTFFQPLRESLSSSFPDLSIDGFATSIKEAVELVKTLKPELVLLEAEMRHAFELVSDPGTRSFETIFIAHSPQRAIDAIRYQPSGYVLKPLKAEELIPAIEVAERRIRQKSVIFNNSSTHPTKQSALFPDNMLGIPTMEGFDFIAIDDIIRLEGYQRCTRIVTTERSDIISSYHIGVFRKKLEGHRFYTTHKSHLINLHHIRKYLKEGSILMSDGGYVPVSKRRKCAFLEMLMSGR